MNEKKKLQARDFITIGIFTAILWVVQMVIMYLGFLSPLIVAGYAVLIPIVTGIPMMLYYERIEKFGMLTITSVIVAILLFIFGMGLTGAPICIVAGLVADFIAKSGNYKSKKKTILSYAVFSLWVTASYLPLVITADSYKATFILRILPKNTCSSERSLQRKTKISVISGFKVLMSKKAKSSVL